jgi:hypothetical protein
MPAVKAAPDAPAEGTLPNRTSPAPRQSPSRPKSHAGISEEQKWALIQRIICSAALSGSPALQAFLRFITTHAIAGTIESIKEQRIGCEVLGRRPDYDPAQDNIVRVRATELRSRLRKYFEESGSSESIILTIPRGSYVPVFQLRDPPLPSDGISHQTVSVPAVVQVENDKPRRSRWGIAVGCALCLVLLIAILLFKTRPSSSEQALNREQTAATRDFWAQLFSQNSHELLVVPADSTFALWQDLAGETLNLGQYIARKPFVVESADRKLREFAARRLTSAADLDIALRLAQLSTAFNGRIRSQYARNLNVHELQTNNVVLIGSRRSNPWVELFETKMNFVLASDPKSGAPIFINRNPEPGEPSQYSIPHMLDSDGTENKEMSAYAHVALVPNLSASGSVLILEGLNMEGTEAAGDFISSSQALNNLLEKLGHRSDQPVQPFEALLNLTSVPGGFANTKLVSWRSLGR